MKGVWQDQILDPYEKGKEVDCDKLVQILKHHSALNSLLKNDLSRDDCQRRVDEARYESYEYILFLIRKDLIITK